MLLKEQTHRKKNERRKNDGTGLHEREGVQKGENSRKGRKTYPGRCFRKIDYKMIYRRGGGPRTKITEERNQVEQLLYTT